MKIGEIIPADREITLNEGKNTVKIKETARCRWDLIIIFSK